ncbi:MAG: M6 family metalloprotease domain-containing protein [Bacteroidaceae bacterium]|nr:M6 family metalloprotease domain-containing protein [Bacteroidaceae bacterium]
MKHILAVCLLLISVTILAVPAKRVKKTITLADGTQKELMLVGDENIHFYLDAENNAYTCNAEGVYVKSDRRKLEKTWKERLARRNKHRLERAKARGMSINPRNGQEPGFRRKAHWGAESNPISGNHTGLVILVNFSDKELNENHGKEYYDRFFNEEGFSADNNCGSVHDYFYECSYGQFNPTFDVYGPVTVSKSYTYYGRNDTNGYDMFPAEMVIEACTKVAEMGVDFSKYDWDGDGLVDQVFCIYAGYGENSYAPANTLWPHECTLTEEAWYGDGDGPVSFNGVTIDTYAISCELDGTSGDTPAGIGVACHEFSHCMCIPDFYDTTGTGRYGMDVWDLMDYGSYAGNQNGNCPAPYTSYERMYCGWLTPKVLSEPCMVTDMGTLYQSPEAYIIYNDANPNEYYMLENRQGEGFDASSPAKGMLVLHVLFDSEVWSSNTTNNTNIQHMTIIPADAVLSHFSNNTDTWPGLTGNTALTDISFPAATLYTPNPDGERFMSKPIEDIVDQNGKISFMFNGGMKIDSPVASEASAVTSYGFTAQWNAVENAANYMVKLTAEDIEPQEYSLEELTIMNEDFSKFNNGMTSDGSTDLSSTLDEYTAIPGWDGEKLFTTPQDEVKLGTARSNGQIVTPWLSAQSGSITLAFTARKYKTDSEPLMIYVGDEKTVELDTEFELTEDPVRYVVTAAVQDNIFWVSLYCEGRCYISEVCVYDGSYTQEQLEAGVISKKNSQTITVETDQTQYQFTNLSSKCQYTYSVCALNEKAHSKWSNPVEVLLPDDPEGIDSIDNGQLIIDNSAGAVYDLSGRKVNCQLSPANSHLPKGIYIVNGKKIIR